MVEILIFIFSGFALVAITLESDEYVTSIVGIIVILPIEVAILCLWIYHISLTVWWLVLIIYLVGFLLIMVVHTDKEECSSLSHWFALMFWLPLASGVAINDACEHCAKELVRWLEYPLQECLLCNRDILTANTSQSIVVISNIILEQLQSSINNKQLYEYISKTSLVDRWMFNHCRIGKYGYCYKCFLPRVFRLDISQLNSEIQWFCNMGDRVLDHRYLPRIFRIILNINDCNYSIVDYPYSKMVLLKDIGVRLYPDFPWDLVGGK